MDNRSNSGMKDNEENNQLEITFEPKLKYSVIYRRTAAEKIIYINLKILKIVFKRMKNSKLKNPL
ncbi:MAG: hypothetical protein ACFFB0_13525 [Promethearchaeota archaeon]